VRLLLILIIVCGPALVAGLVGRQRWGWLWVIVLGASAPFASSSEPAGYEMPGFGIYLRIAAALLALLALGVGVAIRRFRMK
jgi:uncharacterized membrane protein YdbT with pleckstrin-like domain